MSADQSVQIERPAPDPQAAAAVLYNADCPVCRFEISHYRRAAGPGGMRFDPLDAAPGGWGLDRDAAARRLHARRGDGTVVSGFPAFLAIWRGLPGWRHVARVAALPGLRHAVGILYDRVGAPVLYAMHRRRERKRPCSPSSTSSTPPS